MREHPSAPRWNWPNGEQLDETGLQRVEAFARELAGSAPAARCQPPAWLADFVTCCREEVPFYRRRPASEGSFQSLPSCSRTDLAGQPWLFVPDSEPLDALIVFSSSGTTGHPARLPTHPATAACGIPLLERALAPHGVRFPRDAGHMALTQICAYPGAYTTAIVVAYLQEAGCIRLNLCDEDWRAAEDCRTYLDAWHSPVILGDPLAFEALNRVALTRPPQALVSCIATLTEAAAAALQARYACPVIDLYALTEAGIVASRTPRGFEILPHDLYVEVLDEFDQPCPPGVRGEITLTGGRNPFAPLLRYRTGDFAALCEDQGRRYLVELEGRPPVLFTSASGRSVHSMEISRKLRPLPLLQFALHQHADGGFTFRYRGSVHEVDLRQALADCLGSAAPLTLEDLSEAPERQRKVLQYSRD